MNKFEFNTLDEFVTKLEWMIDNNPDYSPEELYEALVKKWTTIWWKRLDKINFNKEAGDKIKAVLDKRNNSDSWEPLEFEEWYKNPEEAWPEGETINWVEEIDEEALKKWWEDAANIYIDAKNSAVDDASWKGNEVSSLVAQEASKLSSYWPLIAEYLAKNPWAAQKIVDKAGDMSKLWWSKFVNWLDNIWWKLLYWTDIKNWGFAHDVIWWGKPFASAEKTVKDIISAKEAKKLWQVTKNSNAASNLTAAQKITWAFQLIWMAAASVDWVANAYSDNKKWVNKTLDTSDWKRTNEILNRWITFADYLDTAITDMIPWVWLVNAIANIVDDRVDESWLAYWRWWVFTKLNQWINNLFWKDSAAAFWEEADADKREKNKEAYDWMQEQWYRNWVWYTKTKEWSKAASDKKESKAIDEMTKKEWQSANGDNAYQSATRYQVQLNKATWAKINDSKGKSTAALSLNDINKKYTRKKLKDWTYDWVSKKTGQSLMNDVKWISKATWKDYRWEAEIKKEWETINI